MKDVISTLKEKLAALTQTVIDLKEAISRLPATKSEIKRVEKAIVLLEGGKVVRHRRSYKRRGRKPGPKKGTKYGKRRAKKSKGPKLSKNGKRMGRPPKAETAAPVAPPKAA